MVTYLKLELNFSSAFALPYWNMVLLFQKFDFNWGAQQYHFPSITCLYQYSQGIERQ